MVLLANGVTAEEEESVKIHSGWARRNTGFQSYIQGVHPLIYCFTVCAPPPLTHRQRSFPTPPPTCNCHATGDHGLLLG